MSSSKKLNVDSSGIIGSLLYFTASRPDIAFSVGVCARYQVAPKESHLTAVKRIIRYINGTPKYGLWYSRTRMLAVSVIQMQIGLVVWMIERVL